MFFYSVNIEGKSFLDVGIIMKTRDLARFFPHRTENLKLPTILVGIIIMYICAKNFPIILNEAYISIFI